MPDVTRKRARLPHGARLLATAPWRRAPLLLLRSPAVLVAVLFAGLVLGATVAATPLFVSSSANAALARQVEQLCPTDSALDVTVRASGVGDSGGLLERRDRAVRQVMAGDPDLGAPLLSVSGPPLSLAGTADPSRTVPARLLYRQGYGDHIRKLRTGVDPGVWVPSQAAGTGAVSPGDQVVLSLNGRTAVTRVAGTYQDLSGLPEAPFWCAARRLVQPVDVLAAAPPPLLLADREVYLDLTRKLQTPLEESWWEVPLSLRENVALPVRLAARGRRARAGAGRADELLGMLGLGELAERAPREASLGEQQRAAVARALVLSPKLLLADEPSAHQDRAWAREILSALHDTAAAGAACLVATHDPEALAFADRAIALEDSRLTELTLS